MGNGAILTFKSPNKRNHKPYESMASNDLTAKCQRIVAYLKLDSTLANWVLQCQAHQVELSAEIIKENGRLFAEQLGIGDDAIEFSNGWLSKFNIRYGFKTQE
ncbi:HTH CenpB-type DNA-binding domain [Forsythia ovata]|uniref:HTH CenpB-type DNA-binding domain n=1 Tax=Forsythia ovata TaxID=205694 RepID=A0ABD1XCC2_9LAMI